jgi:hypothetical protein
MTKSKLILPALFLGVALLGGTSVYAFGGGTFPVEAFNSFSAEKQTAIAKAHEIRTTAHTEAEKVLTQAGVSKEDVHTAMKAFHEQHKTAMNAALEANDFNAFKALMADGPHAETLDKITEDVFAKMVKMYQLEKSGDKAGAKILRTELREAGFGGGMGMGGHGGKEKGGRMHGGGMMDADAR